MNTVLIVDADPVERNLVSRYLTDAGYCVLEAANTLEAVRIAELFEAEIHLAIVATSDVIDLVKEIAAIRASLPILVASQHLDVQLLSCSMPSTVNMVLLQKPLIPVVLLDKVRGLLSRM